MRHTWNESDDIVALYLHKFGERGLGMTKTAAAERRGIKPGSMRMRIQNFASLTADSSLDHAAQLSRDVLARYGKLSESELRALAEEALA